MKDCSWCDLGSVCEYLALSSQGDLKEPSEELQMLMIPHPGAENPTSRSQESSGQPPVRGGFVRPIFRHGLRSQVLCPQGGIPSPLHPCFPDSPEDLLGRATLSDGSWLRLSKKPGFPMKTSQY